MLKRFVIVLSLFVLVSAGSAGLAPAQPVSAQSSTSSSGQNTNPIESGLWSAYYLIFGSSSSSSSSTTQNSTAPDTSSSASTSSRPQATPPPAAVNTAGSYVALGDSVAAGIGLPTPAAVPQRETRCGRTAKAYPNTVARGVNLPLVQVACSGADVDELYTKDRIGGRDLPAQLDTAFAGGTPRLMSLTAGANDVSWQNILRRCYSTNCATQSYTNRVNRQLVQLQNRYVRALDQIDTRSGGAPPTVVVTGYYNPLSAACTSVTPRITADEVYWMTASVDAINKTIQQTVAVYPFARFAPVDFTGHDICSVDPWVQGLEDPAPIHPTAAGQEVMAQAVLRAANNY